MKLRYYEAREISIKRSTCLLASEQCGRAIEYAQSLYTMAINQSTPLLTTNRLKENSRWGF